MSPPGRAKGEPRAREREGSPVSLAVVPGVAAR